MPFSDRDVENYWAPFDPAYMDLESDPDEHEDDDEDDDDEEDDLWE